MEPLTRTETLQVLNSMGIEIPVDAKISPENLDKRLRSALDAAQYKDRLPPTLDINALPEWPMCHSGEGGKGTVVGRPLLEAVKRGNWHEAWRNYEAKKAGLGTAQPALYTDPFMDLRQTVMGIGNFLDNGAKWCYLEDKDEQCALNIRMVSVHEINAETPAIVVMYRAYGRSTALQGVDWLFDQADRNPAQLGDTLLKVHATPLEQKLLLRVLKQNAGLIPPDVRVHKQPGEREFDVSVLLPVGPLEFDALSKLNSKTCCAVCGRPAEHRCSQCQSVSYCRPKCQKTDWPEHKAFCRSLQGGRWVTLRTRSGPEGMEDMYIALLNHRSSTSRSLLDMAPTKIDPSAPPPDIWGTRLFLVKIQVALTTVRRSEFLLYDRKRSFKVFAYQADQRGAFGELDEEMVGPRGGYGGAKMYRWAKRTGDWEFSICVDREPQTDMRW
ncbi:hypothetical protein C8Q80DRAFT_1267075 [Daedaleopsis nitida]|nr:hypothetical protein C8Q80DRAFT_1267075 [Daedaleopsis nitida]